MKLMPQFHKKKLELVPAIISLLIVSIGCIFVWYKAITVYGLKLF